MTRTTAHGARATLPSPVRGRQRLEYVGGEFCAPAFGVGQEYAELDLGPVFQRLYVTPGDRHRSRTDLVLRQGRNAPLERPRGRLGRLQGRFLLRRQRLDTELVQALTLPRHEALPHSVFALPLEPFADVHAVDGDAGLQLGQRSFVGQEFACGGVVPLPVDRTVRVPVRVDRREGFGPFRVAGQRTRSSQIGEPLSQRPVKSRCRTGSTEAPVLRVVHPGCG